MSEVKDHLGARVDSWVELLRRRAEGQAERPAFSFVAGDGEIRDSVTYGAMDRRARALGAWLQERGLAGERILLLYPPGLDFVTAFFGCLYGGALAVPAYPPRLRRRDGRIEAIFADATPRAIFTVSGLYPRLATWLREQGLDGDLELLATDGVDAARADLWRDPGSRRETLAFLQYTSGSTSSPKGVMVSHGNLLANGGYIRFVEENSGECVGASWLPSFHDMGLIEGVLQPIYSGYPSYLMAPVSFLQNPILWLQTISRFGVTNSGGPNFAYELCLRRIGEEERRSLDLSTWRVAYNGAEPVRAVTMERFARAFEGSGFRWRSFYPVYGLAEATLLVSSGRNAATPLLLPVDGEALEGHWVEVAGPRVEEVRQLVGCGPVGGGFEVAVVDPESGKPSAADRVGEIWLSGPSVAQGYWNLPQETAQAFRARLPDSPERDFLRTGDLGFLRDGEIFITGRLKDLIIIRGRNVYPQDLELTAEGAHPAVRPGCCAAFAVREEGTEAVALACEIQPKGVDPRAVAESLRQAVAAAHEVSPVGILLLEPGGLPKTSSGKVQRHAAARAYRHGGLPTVRQIVFGGAPGPARDVEPLAPEALQGLPPEEGRQLVSDHVGSLLASVLGIPAAAIEASSRLGSLGLDSLSAVDLKNAFEANFGAAPSLSFLLAEATPERLVEGALEALAEGSPGVPSAPAGGGAEEGEAGDSPSSGQRALWFLQRLAPSSSAFHIAAAARFTEAPDLPALGRALGSVVQRHEALRTVFEEGPQGPRRVVAPDGPAELLETPPETAAGDLEGELTRIAGRPFDLERGPLLRLAVLDRAAPAPVLLLVIHHLVADFWSLGLILEELGEAYRRELKGEPRRRGPGPSFRRFAGRQRAWLETPAAAAAEDYWRRRLEGAPAALDLPVDRERPQIQTFEGGVVRGRLGRGICQGLETLRRRQAWTPHCLLMTAFTALLQRLTGTADVVVGTPTSGRTDGHSRGVVGYLVNPVALRAAFSPAESFRQASQGTWERSLEAQEHQEYPFPRLVERLQPHRDAARSPVFQVFFVHQRARLPGVGDLAAFALGAPGGLLEAGPLSLESLPWTLPSGQFELMLMAGEAGGRQHLALHFNRDLFDPSTAHRLLGHYRILLAAAVEDPDRAVADLPLLSRGEREELLRQWNPLPGPVPAEPLHQRVFSQAARTPAAPALVVGGETWSYGELESRARRLARYLRRMGVGPEVRVGIFCRRSAEMAVAVLGTLAAGGTYVPLDPAYPRERLAFMAEDGGLALLLTHGQVPELPARCPVVDVSRGVRRGEQTPPRTLAHPDPENLAYVLYTSGSTGRPKGVAIPHRAAAALVDWARRAFSPEELAGVLASTSICFDLSVFELFVPWSTGGTVVLARDALELPQLPAAERVRLINTVPSALGELLRLGALPRSLITVNLAGEPLLRPLADAAYALPSVSAVNNLYGPSEDTTYSTWARVPEGSAGAPTIGRPIRDTTAYVVDRRGGLQPVGVPGELLLGGHGLARGYLGRGGLTAETFVPDPFGAKPGGRLYRTGDLARFLPDGELELLGRRDHQVKLRGFRIELDEVSSALAEHPRVKEAVAVVREGTVGPRLVGYFSLTGDGAEAAEAAEATELRRFLEDRLPAFMVPGELVALERLPRTPNGKVDRRALPAPALSGGEAAEALAPRTALEEALAGIWASTLGRGAVGVDQDFFELGGHSLLATRLIAAVNRSFRVDLPISALFQAPTIAAFGRRLREQEAAPGRLEKIAGVLVRIQRMSPQEVEAALAAQRTVGASS